MSLSSRDRRELRRVLSLVLIGDRTGAASALRVLTMVPSPVPPEQLALPSLLEATFRCERTNTDRMRVRDCLTKRSRVWASGHAEGSPTEQAIICGGCRIGATLAQQLPHYTPPKSTIPRASSGRRGDAA